MPAHATSSLFPRTIAPVYSEDIYSITWISKDIDGGDWGFGLIQRVCFQKNWHGLTRCTWRYKFMGYQSRDNGCLHFMLVGIYGRADGLPTVRSYTIAGMNGEESVARMPPAGHRCWVGIATKPEGRLRA